MEMECLPTPLLRVSPYIRYAINPIHPHTSHETLNEVWKCIQKSHSLTKIIKPLAFFCFTYIYLASAPSPSLVNRMYSMFFPKS